MLRSGATPTDPVERRMLAVLDAASYHGTALPLTEVPSLLPLDGPASPRDVARWVLDHPEHAVLLGESVARSGTPPPTRDDILARRSRGTSYLERADELFSGPLAPPTRWIRCACVTGSTAYREPLAGDDLDFLVVTRTGATWAFLTWAWLILRFQRGAEPPAGSHWCLNFVVDESEARALFQVPRGFHVAREALTARPVVGGPFYAGLLRFGRWMEAELPRLYAHRQAEVAVPAPMAMPAPWMVRALNLLLFPVVAVYVQLKGLVVNRDLRDAGRSGDAFRTRTHLGRFSLESDRFARMSHRYEATPAATDSGGAAA